MPALARIDHVTKAFPARGNTPSDVVSIIERYTRLAVTGLGAMYQATTRSFPTTVRGSGPGQLRPEGMSIRYTAIAALGLAQLPEESQRQVLGGGLASGLLPNTTGLALAGRDPGAVALALWACAEILPADLAEPGGTGTGEPTRVEWALERLMSTVRDGLPIPTVDHSWTVTALVAARQRAHADLAEGHSTSPFALAAHDLDEAAGLAAGRLMAAQGPGGLFPHYLPAGHLSRFRAHVGCFADQVYPIQALARYAMATGDASALSAAQVCADGICALQGSSGQWWWHYDSRGSSVVEDFPVYSVHQHGMAPMALLELQEAGGPDHSVEVLLGLSWIERHPESGATLIDEDLGVIWRKIGRREPAKFVRRLRAATTSLRPGRRLEFLNVLFPPGSIDHECRPYELGWLLYAWHSGGSGHRRDQASDDAAESSTDLTPAGGQS